MTIFDVYIKEGAMFPLEMRGFEVQGEEFVLTDEAGKPSSEGFLRLSQIAAVVPQTQRDKNAVRFHVHLKGHERPAQVFASAFQLEGNEVKFAHRQYDMMGKVMNEWPVEYIYVAASEVVAIVPADGLKYRER